MKPISLLLLLLFACNSSHHNKLCISGKETFLWEANIDKNGNDYLIKNKKFIKENDLDKLISVLNINYPIDLRKLDFKNDTLVLNISDDIYFTQQMGTTGAIHTKAVIIFSLTEISTVNYIHLQFTEGDHGGKPGVFSRKDFLDYFLIIDCT